MTSDHRPGANRGTLLLADISGYTAFLEGVGAEHGAEMAETGEVPEAYPIMMTLLDGIVERLVPPFTLSKTEGDAVFAFAADADLPLRGQSLLACMSSCYSAFQENVAAMERALTCGCSACSFGITLDLKFVMHHGGYVLQPIAGRQELLGPDVNAVHRLLKNHAADVVGNRAYALFTRSAADHLEIPVTTATPVTETYDHVGQIETFVFPVPFEG
ncbi:MAG: DUF2652 domain-containing protein [Dehalococcoidia bacterium]|jgi:hypothetical protein|nr:DUF2652 domain-containing protein [Dehalococcoidia bacterium]